MNQSHPDRVVRHRLAAIRHAREVSGNVAATCRYYGISRPTFYAWARRLDLEGPDGLRERSRAAKSHPQETSAEGVGKIIHLRQTYHFGPAKISMYLKRYHDVEVSTPVSGGSSRDWTSTACRAPSATSATNAAGSGTRSSNPGIGSRST